MGYVAVRGGGLAIEESLKLLERQRVEGLNSVSVDAVEDSSCRRGIEAGAGLTRRGGVSAARVSLDA